MVIRRVPFAFAAAALAAGCSTSIGPSSLPQAGTSGSSQIRAHVTEKVLYSFTGGSDGGGPNGAVVFDGSGNIFGTTHFGGMTQCGGNVGGGCGVVFELAPKSGGWAESALYAFSDSSDGGFPNAGVVLDKNGNLFGTASTGGNFQCSIGCGVVYELLKSTGWGEHVLHAFAGSDGQFPNAVLLQGSNGTFYSTTWFGGSTGNGTVFSLTPSGSSWMENVLYSFGGAADGSAPAAGVIADSAGNLYGTTYKFDGYNDGVAYELQKRSHGSWKDRVLYSFTGQGGGEDPYAGLILRSKRRLYGTTIEGGSNGGGAAFELTDAHHHWTERDLHVFGGAGDGSTPYGGLVADRAGNLFGTTLFGGTNNSGTVYELSRTRGAWKERVLYSFTGGDDGGNPGGTLTFDSAGNLYGTAGGGQSGNGVIFEIVRAAQPR